MNLKRWLIVAPFIAFIPAILYAQQAYIPNPQYYQPTFSQWLFSGMFSPVTLLCVAFGSSIVGMVAHWFKKVQRDGEQVSLIEWVVVDFRKTLYTLGGVLLSVWAAVAPMPVGELSLWSAIAIGFPLGFAADSTLNNVSAKSLSMRRLKVAKQKLAKQESK